MPFSTSPYQANDYQAASAYRPYALPGSNIFKAVAAQSSYWDQGAERVKNVYDQAMGMNLTMDANKEVSKNFMLEADKEITKLSSMNLADPSIQRQGFGIFKPLISDKSIMIDNHLSNLRSQIVNDALSFRDKKLSPQGSIGEGFSETNLRYALDGFQDFKSTTPRDEKQLMDLYNKLGSKSYTPYYNYNKEMQTIVDHCKGPTTQTAGTLGDYIQTTLQSGASNERLRSCLTYNLSDKAKDQINIEGIMKFKNQDGTPNYQALADSYSSSYNRESQGLKTSHDQISARLLVLKEAYKKTPSENIKKEIDFENQMLQSNEGRYKNLAESFNKLKLGDMNFLKKEYDGLASGIYTSSLIDGFSEAFNNQTAKSTLQANPISVLGYRITATHNENILQHGYKMDELEAEHKFRLQENAQKLLGKKLKVNPDGSTSEVYEPINPASKSTDVTNTGRTEFMAGVAATQAVAAGMTQEFYNGHVADEWHALGKKDEDFYNAKTGELTPAGLQYVQDGNKKDLPWVQEYLHKMEMPNLQATVQHTVQKLIDTDQDIAKLNADFRSKLNDTNYAPVHLSQGETVHAVDIVNALEGRDDTLRIIKHPGTGSSTFMGPGMTVTVADTPNEYYVKGRKLSPNEGQLMDRAVSTLESAKGNHTSDVLSRINSLYSQAQIAQEGRVSGEALNLDEKNETRSAVATAVSQAGGVGTTIANVRISSFNPINGNATIVVGQLDKVEKIPSEAHIREAVETLMQTASVKSVHTHGNAVTLEITDRRLVDETMASNPYTALQGTLNSLENVMKKTSSLAPGKDLKDATMVIRSPRDKTLTYQIVPYKSFSGEILWRMKTEYNGPDTETQKKGDFISRYDNLTSEQIISKVNQ